MASGVLRDAGVQQQSTGVAKDGALREQARFHVTVGGDDAAVRAREYGCSMLEHFA
jgi:hypothetical protein